MKPSTETLIKFYQQLGKVFYAIASVDEVVREKELIELRKILKKEWIPLEDSVDKFGTDSAFQIEIVFDWLLANEWKIKEAVEDLEYFKKEHESLFSPSVRKLILKTADAIASTFSGVNKSESELLNSLYSVIEA
jgi:hypothetical protein